MRWLWLTVLVVFFVYAQKLESAESAQPDEHDKKDDESLHSVEKVYGEANDIKAQEHLNSGDEAEAKNDQEEKPPVEETAEGSAEENLAEQSESNDETNNSAKNLNSTSSENVEGSPEQDMVEKSNNNDKGSLSPLDFNLTTSEKSENVEGSAEEDLVAKSSSSEKSDFVEESDEKDLMEKSNNDTNNASLDANSVVSEKSESVEGSAEEDLVKKPTSSETSEVIASTTESPVSLPAEAETPQKNDSISDTASVSPIPLSSLSEEMVSTASLSMESASDNDSEQSQEISSANDKIKPGEETQKSESDSKQATSLKSSSETGQPSYSEAGSVPQSLSSSSADENSKKTGKAEASSALCSEVSNVEGTAQNGIYDHPKDSPVSSSKKLTSKKIPSHSPMKSADDSDSKSSEADSSSEEEGSAVLEESMTGAPLEPQLNVTSLITQSEESGEVKVEGSADSPYAADPNEDIKISTEQDNNGYLKATDNDSVSYEKSKEVSEEGSGAGDDTKSEKGSGAEGDKNNEENGIEKKLDDGEQAKDGRNENKEENSPQSNDGEENQMQKENDEKSANSPMSGIEKEEENEKSDEVEQLNTGDKENKKVNETLDGNDMQSSDEAAEEVEKIKNLEHELVNKSSDVNDVEGSGVGKVDAIERPSNEATNSDQKGEAVGKDEHKLEKLEGASESSNAESGAVSSEEKAVASGNFEQALEKVEGANETSSNKESGAVNSDEKGVTFDNDEHEVEKLEGANAMNKSEISIEESSKLPNITNDNGEDVDGKDNHDEKQLQPVDEKNEDEITTDNEDTTGAIENNTRLITKVDSASKDEKVVIEYKSSRPSEIGEHRTVAHVFHRMTPSLSNTIAPLTFRAHNANSMTMNKKAKETMTTLDSTMLAIVTVDANDMDSVSTTTNSLRVAKALHKPKSTLLLSSHKDRASKHHSKFPKPAKFTEKPELRSVINRDLNSTRRFERFKTRKDRFNIDTSPRKSLTLHKKSVYSDFPRSKSLASRANFLENSKIIRKSLVTKSPKDSLQPKNFVSKKYSSDQNIHTKSIELPSKKSSRDFPKPTELSGKHYWASFPQPKKLSIETSTLSFFPTLSFIGKKTTAIPKTKHLPVNISSLDGNVPSGFPSINSSLDLAGGDIVLDQKLKKEEHFLKSKASKYTSPQKQKAKKFSEISYLEFPRPKILPINVKPHPATVVDSGKHMNSEDLVISNDKLNELALKNINITLLSNTSNPADVITLAELKHGPSPQPRPIFIEVPALPELLPLNITVTRRKIRRYRKRMHRKGNKSPQKKLKRVIILGKPAREYDSPTKRLPGSIVNSGVEESVSKELIDFASRFHADKSNVGLSPGRTSLGESVDELRYRRAKDGVDVPSPSVKSRAYRRYVAPYRKRIAPQKPAVEIVHDKLTAPAGVETTPEVHGSLQTLNQDVRLVERQHKKALPKYRYDQPTETTNGDEEPDPSGNGSNASVADDVTDSGSSEANETKSYENSSEAKEADRPSDVEKPSDGLPPTKELIANTTSDTTEIGSETDLSTTAQQKWTPYQFNCDTEKDDKGALCKEWAAGGLCAIHKPTMFLFCRKTCLCVGPNV